LHLHEVLSKMTTYVVMLSFFYDVTNTEDTLFNLEKIPAFVRVIIVNQFVR